MDYKKYSLEHLENWLYDAMSCGDATPQEIYDVILKVVKDEYYTYKKKASESYELLALLNGNGDWKVEDVMKEKEYYEPSMPPWGHSDLEYLACNKDDPSPECQKSWNDFWEENYYPEENKLHVSEDGDIYPVKEDKVVKWQLPVELDGLTGECFVQFPDDLLEAANLKEGDEVNWIDRGDGSFELRKVTKNLKMDEC